MQMSAKNSVDSVRMEMIANMKIPLPPLPEQNRIVAVLEVWDKAIEKLTRKIELKRNVKKGLMQQLLTGKKRLPGFTGEWRMVKLGDVCERLKRKNSIRNGNVLTISAQDGLVNQMDYFNKRIAADNLNKYTLLHKGDFAYNKSYSKGYPMGAIKRLRKYKKGVVSSLYITFSATKISDVYLDYYFDCGLFNKELGKVAQEGARNHGLLNIGISEFFECDLHIPTLLKEQNTIAEVLTTADDEITELEKKLTLIKDQKKYLLNNLITGCIRTPENLLTKEAGRC